MYENDILELIKAKEKRKKESEKKKKKKVESKETKDSKTGIRNKGENAKK